MRWFSRLGIAVTLALGLSLPAAQQAAHAVSCNVTNHHFVWDPATPGDATSNGIMQCDGVYNIAVVITLGPWGNGFDTGLEGTPTENQRVCTASNSCEIWTAGFTSSYSANQCWRSQIRGEAAGLILEDEIFGCFNGGVATLDGVDSEVDALPRYLGFATTGTGLAAPGSSAFLGDCMATLDHSSSGPASQTRVSLFDTVFCSYNGTLNMYAHASLYTRAGTKIADGDSCQGYRVSCSSSAGYNYAVKGAGYINHFYIELTLDSGQTWGVLPNDHSNNCSGVGTSTAKCTFRQRFNA
jgi:hypothetical protein